MVSNRARHTLPISILSIIVALRNFRFLIVFVITSKVSRISTRDIGSIYSLESVLSFDSICFIAILDIFEVIAKIAKCSTLRKAIRDSNRFVKV